LSSIIDIPAPDDNVWEPKERMHGFRALDGNKKTRPELVGTNRTFSVDKTLEQVVLEFTLGKVAVVA
jgi:hypothetical protein